MRGCQVSKVIIQVAKKYWKMDKGLKLAIFKQTQSNYKYKENGFTFVATEAATRSESVGEETKKIRSFF